MSQDSMTSKFPGTILSCTIVRTRALKRYLLNYYRLGHSHKKGKDGLEKLLAFSRILMLTWNFRVLRATLHQFS